MHGTTAPPTLSVVLDYTQCRQRTWCMRWRLAVNGRGNSDRCVVPSDGWCGARRRWRYATEMWRISRW